MNTVKRSRTLLKFNFSKTVVMFHVKTPLSGSLLGHSIVEVSHSRPGDCGAALPGRPWTKLGKLANSDKDTWPVFATLTPVAHHVGGRGVHGDQGEHRG